MREHVRIAAFFAPLAADEPGSFNLTDDAAVLTPPPGTQLVITTDSVIRGVHVPNSATATQMARKLMRRNLSDLAAMGATPWRYLLNLHTLPSTEDDWFAAFATALAEEQKRFGLTLIGGDTTSGKGPLAATITCLGLLSGAPLRRNGALAGDVLYVSGTIGDAALGLKLLQRTLHAEKPARVFLTQRYFQPEPRLALGEKLAGIASAALDCSDGLLADVMKLAEASHMHITIEQDAIPLSPAAKALLAGGDTLWETILGGGDDYELIFTAPSSATAVIESLSASLGLPLTRIGRVTAGDGIGLVDAHGNTVAVKNYGWEH